MERIIKRAENLLQNYASFNEASNEQFLEDAMNVLYAFKEKAMALVTEIASVAERYSDMDDDIEEPIVNLLNDITKI